MVQTMVRLGVLDDIYATSNVVDDQEMTCV